MISYLDKILESSKEKVLLDKIAQPYLTIKSKIKDLEEPSRFIDSINKRRRAGLVSVIAESKKASPSQGLIRENYDPVQIAQSYYDNNATCMSVLTNEEFFKGSLSHLEAIKASVNIPLLRKDFIVSNAINAKLIGADCILLIVAALTSSQLSEYYDLASELGMDVLVEVHDEEEIKRALEISPQFIGINNRNLNSFEVDLNTTERLSDLIPDEILCISESGIRTKEDISRVLECGVSSFLVGESFMRSKDPGQELQNLFSLKKT